MMGICNSSDLIRAAVADAWVISLTGEVGSAWGYAVSFLKTFKYEASGMNMFIIRIQAGVP
jgi:hypothetical protein